MRTRGLSEKNGTLITLYDREATEAGIHNGVKRALRAAKGRPRQDRTLLVIYFAGHGEKGYLIPYGADHESDYIMTESLERWAKPDNGVRHQLLILGSCYSGWIFRSNALKGEEDLKTFSPAARWFRDSLRRPARLALTAGRDDEIVPER